MKRDKTSIYKHKKPDDTDHIVRDHERKATRELYLWLFVSAAALLIAILWKAN